MFEFRRSAAHQSPNRQVTQEPEREAIESHQAQIRETERSRLEHDWTERNCQMPNVPVQMSLF